MLNVLNSVAVVIAIVLLVSCSMSTSAQNLPPILKSDKPKAGIYRKFEEFLNDSPSVQLRIVLRPRSKSKQFWLGGNDFDLMVPDGAGGLRKANRYWGVSDGDSVYVNASNYQQSRGYVKFKKLGRFCYTKGLTSDIREGNAGYMAGGIVGGAVGGAIAGAAGGVLHDAAFIFNINNGKFIMLTPEVLIKILERDEPLLSEYRLLDKREQQDPDEMLTYVEKFNRRHEDEIRPERLANIVIYRREKKERVDSVTLITGDSLRYILGVNDLAEFEVPKPNITLCSSGECQTFPITEKTVNYFQCLYREGDKAEVQVREIKDGEYYQRQIRYIQDHPQR